MKKEERLYIIFVLLAFIACASGFWVITGYQANWDVEKLRRMVVIRAGFSFTLGCVGAALVCIFRILVLSFKE